MGKENSKDKAIKIEDIIKRIRVNMPEGQLLLVEKAYKYALEAHRGQTRISGEEYIVHPVGVANILADLQIDPITISAGFLHDVVEDTAVNLADIENNFGKDIAMLVDGVTKLSRIEYKSKEERQLESYRKMFLAMAKDIRVVLIKLADRLHNMRTLKFMPPEKQKEISRETLEIFAPLANRLGIYNIKWELEDLAFRFIEPEKYYSLVEQVKQKRQERENIINEAMNSLRDRLDFVDIKAEIQGRPKHFFSIYKKMQKGYKDVSEIYDLSAIRIIVENVKDCYAALGIVHTLWKPLPGRFKDYIAMPKSNMYQSLHTTVIGVWGQPLEIQIRTWEMHRIADYGIAAHWKYKEGKTPIKEIKGFDEKLSWVRQLLEWHQELRDPREFLETVKLDVFADEVFVFTPKGDVIGLPMGSVPIDFAYRIHTDIGHRCISSRINGKIVPLEYKLKNGDIVEIVTAKHVSPSRDWINIVRSTDAKTKIRQWFKKANREENIVKGREILEREVKKLGYEWRDLVSGERLIELAKKMNLGTEEDLLAGIGYGGIALHILIGKIMEAHKKELKKETSPDLSQILAELKPEHKKSKQGHGILVKGESGLMVRFSRCCNPVPGDKIVGYITRGRGVSIHHTDCSNANNPLDFERIVEVAWDIEKYNEEYRVSVEVTALDRPGVLSEIMTVVSESKTNICSVNAKTQKNKVATMLLVLSIGNLAQLEIVINKLKRMRDVYNVQRVSPGTVGGTI